METNKSNEFRTLRKIIGLTQTELAERLELSLKTISNYEIGLYPIPDDKMEALRELAAEKMPKIVSQPQIYGSTTKDIQSKLVTMPLIPFSCVAGLPSTDNEGIPTDDYEQYSVPEFSIRGAEFLIRVEGMSMFPRYTNGDILAVKRLSSVTFFQWGCVYVLDTEQGMLIKRLFKSSNPDNITCHSENSVDFPDFEIPKSEIRNVLIVLGRISLC